jgi:hypothetical protein
VSADRVPRAPLAEFFIGADKDRPMLRGPYRQLVISGARQACGTRTQALVTLLPQHPSDRGIHVVIKQESH